MAIIPNRFSHLPYLCMTSAHSYLAPDGIVYSGEEQMVQVWVEGTLHSFGVHAGTVNGVRLFFLHNPLLFPRPYPRLDAKGQTRVLTAFAKASLELLCRWPIIPGIVVTNDWFTGLAAGYARDPRHFGRTFDATQFIHIAHNLDPSYEGRLYPSVRSYAASPPHCTMHAFNLLPTLDMRARTLD